MRRPTVSVAEYVAELRKLAQDCNYGETLPQMLRDRLVCGINDDRIQRRLLSETNLTFESALSLAQAMESANKNVQDLQAKAGAMSCNAVRAGGAESMGQKRRESQGRSEKDKDCYRCRGKHAPEDCRFKKEKCHACGMTGHIARACRNKKKSTAEGRTDRRPRESGRHVTRERKVHYCSPRVAEGSDEEEQPFSLYSVQDEDEGEGVPPYKVCMTLNGETVTFEVETGCGLTILNMETFKEKVKNAPTLKKTCLKLRTYTKQKIKLMGKIYVKVNYISKKRYCPS